MIIKRRDIFWIIVTVILCSISLLLYHILDNAVSSLPIIGTFVIVVSICMIIRYRNINSISLLVGIISLISISFAYSICFNIYNSTFNWQIPLLHNELNIINAKNYLVFLSFLSLSIGKLDLKNNNKLSKIPKFDYNPLIILGSVLFLLYALFFGFDRGTVGKYTSNTNPIYEYALIVFTFAWQYSKDNKFFKTFLITYAILYCGQGLMFGDRSSAFPMIILLLILRGKNNVKMKNVIFVGLAGIFVANVVDIFRTSGDLFSMTTIEKTLSRGLFVNTISYSFYGGTQILRYGLKVSLREKFVHLLRYGMTFIKGGSGKYNLSTLANAAGFVNKGGGMSLSYSYFWGGILGTILLAIIIGIIINIVFSHNNKLCNVLKITLTIFTIRWFVYYPTAFFRTALIVPIVCYLLLTFFNNGLKINSNIKKK